MQPTDYLPKSIGSVRPADMRNGRGMTGFEWFLLIVVVIVVPLIVAIVVTLWTLEQARQRNRKNRTGGPTEPVKRRATRQVSGGVQPADVPSTRDEAVSRPLER